MSAEQTARDLALVGLGGAAGTLTRALVSSAIGEAAASPIPWGTLTVNLVGSLAIGALFAAVGALATRRARHLWLLLGTGLLGGFTTYSAFAVETTELLAVGDFALGLGYACGSLAAGVLCALAGFRLVSGALDRRRGGSAGEVAQ